MKVWDLADPQKIPTMVFFDTEGKIVSADFRAKDNMHLCIDEEGLVVMRNLKNNKEFKKMSVEKDNYRYVKFNPLNEFQYFLCGEKSFKIFDVRSHFELDSINQFADSINIFGDSSGYLIGRKSGIELYNSQVELLKGIDTFGEITHINMRSVNYTRPDMIIIGNENGDLFCGI